MTKPTSTVTNKPVRPPRPWAIALAGALVLTGGAVAAFAALKEPSAPPNAPFRIEEIADLDQPWAMTFLPDGRMLITEKAGQLLMLSADGKQRKTVTGAPAVTSQGQGGLMDVVLHPRFAKNRMVYFSYSEAAGKDTSLVLARGVFNDGDAPSLRNVQTLFRGPRYDARAGHYSGRIAFSPEGKLFFAVGDRQQWDGFQRTDPQDIKILSGKVLRLNDDGTPAAGNPLAARGGDPAIWTYGHRNLLGLAFDANGNLWEQEMGPLGGDEVNLILPGRNYGWPVVSNGDNYPGPPTNGAAIPDHRPGDGFEAPKVWWSPAISPAGMMVYSGKLWPQWRGDLFIGGLSSQSLVRVDVNGPEATKGDQFALGTRIREPEEGPDGSIYLLTDGRRGFDGKLVKLTPKR
ncbi:MAG: PQQ-dependent sugar dehydrogenase [Phenylobacterium sp.]|uniref:PQQ-dependent sugar dehydrogenase n=1 Tax=Phenylobacterium sp. TaxID=1871053 RepID=UPI0025D4F36E|nr:PQQ-dependent sugar dehydrogenase [Phenylobacterium sp.]MCA3745047.1 PQQ-dependent sugar dehydrogenase [Phenylobacterium sp.]MCA3750657.1 PQQ-dependent sugar dehydrogenase [Phenylobacterium sp.]MCA6246372.1 PQQ-dependent sugar dehydrogenase [Phenylobacterium sp.]MCA6276458.1 PQQ-dependent sugar dehydrogenase [Phenylobacterium sp.]MCA6282213.1 PQQ-dependent sugar dehydrogenase [Phenylobacterium sp.]